MLMSLRQCLRQWLSLPSPPTTFPMADLERLDRRLSALEQTLGSLEQTLHRESPPLLSGDMDAHLGAN